MKNRLSRQELRVRNAFSGGKTLDEMRKTVRDLQVRQLRNILRKLLATGELQDLNRGEHGPIAHRYMPASDSFGPERPHSRSAKHEDVDESIVIIHQDAKEALTAIMASRRTRTPKRIRELCNQWIKPVLSDIMELIRATSNIYMLDLKPKRLHPGVFFTEDYASTWKHKSSLERKGTLRVRHPDSISEEDWFYPSIREWEKYLEEVIDATMSQYNGHILRQAMKDDQAEP